LFRTERTILAANAESLGFGWIKLPTPKSVGIPELQPLTGVHYSFGDSPHKMNIGIEFLTRRGLTMQADPPRLRPGLAVAKAAEQPDQIILYDQLRISREPLQLQLVEYAALTLIDGLSSPEQIRTLTSQKLKGLPIEIAVIESLLHRLDEALMLDNLRFQNRLFGKVREPSCIGSYSGHPDQLRLQLSTLFTAEGGPGLPDAPGCRVATTGKVRAILAPHIDYGRGGVTYGYAFKELIERTEASLFVIVGTAHYSGERFTLSRQHFKTPLGIAETDQKYIDRLVEAYGDGLFDDPIAHIPEHSIELEVLLLQFLLQRKRKFRIVPLLVGSFRDSVQDGVSPETQEDIARMIDALRKVEASAGEEVCYIISGDLAHIGPFFGEDAFGFDGLTERDLQHSLAQDEQILAAAADVDTETYFRVIEREKDARFICGLPPTWLVMQALQLQQGTLLHYGRYVDPEGDQSVSFASMAFD
jgi:MEMO1 family protein